MTESNESNEGIVMDHAELEAQCRAIFDPTLPVVSNLSNLASVIFHSFNDAQRPINWVGFYLYDEENGSLVLGPFIGRPACTKIMMGAGVCGLSAQQGATVIVENVHSFPGHIACDSKSESEIVVPIITRSGLYGVLDIDAEVQSEFTSDDRKALESIIKHLAIGLAERSSRDLLN